MAGWGLVCMSSSPVLRVVRPYFLPTSHQALVEMEPDLEHVQEKYSELEMQTHLLSSRSWTNLHKMVKPVVEARARSLSSGHTNSQKGQRGVVFIISY